MNKTAIVILSDPKNGSEESFGRVFNALASAYDYKTAGEEVTILFQGTGTRWPEQLKKEDHMLNKLYKAVEDKIQGISSGCAVAFGADTSGFDLVKDNQVPGTSGLPSFVKLKKDGFNVITF
jgi:hypothetical protein